MVEQIARYEDVRIQLREPVHGLESVSGVLGIPEWWPTGARVCILLAHGSQANDPLLENLARELTERKYLTLRFVLPYVEAKKRGPDESVIVRRTFAAAADLVSQDPTASPAHLFIGGKNQGALAAAHAVAGQLQASGLFFLSYPLHPRSNPNDVRAERLFRAVGPLLFIQGSKDRYCQTGVLKRTLVRVGAPWDLHLIAEADHDFRFPKNSDRNEEELHTEILERLDSWINHVLGE